MEMTLEQMKIYTPAIRLISGLEMAGYRLALLESLDDDNVSAEESKAIAHEYDRVLEFYCMGFRPEIQ
jgi:hypothetical protein